MGGLRFLRGFAVPEWYADALCAQVDGELWFPERGGSVAEAKKVCAACPVRAQCLDYALANGERWGVWGGRSERERRKLARTAPRTPGRCRAGLHEMTDANTHVRGDGARVCRACAAAAEKRRRDRRRAA